MPKVRYFEVTADDPERAVRFYSQAFGWFAEKWQHPEGYWQVSTGEEDEPGIGGAIRRRMPEDGGTIPFVDVDDLTVGLEHVLEAGGTVAQGRVVIPRFGYVAYCCDTEGNLFGLVQFDPEAPVEG